MTSPRMRIELGTEQGAATLRRATLEDRPALERLLANLHLPIEGVAHWLERFWIVEHGGEIVGSVGTEHYGEAALLRSVAVHAAWRDRGLGRALVDIALDAARSDGARHVYLLTTTAESYFPRLGFERIEREAVPAAVRASVEFREACPASAVVMRRPLAGEP